MKKESPQLILFWSYDYQKAVCVVPCQRIKMFEIGLIST